MLWVLDQEIKCIVKSAEIDVSRGKCTLKSFSKF